MDNQEKKETQLFLNRFDKIIVNITFLLLGVVIIVQCLMIVDPLRRYLNITENLEGQPITPKYVTVADSTEFNSFATITIILENYSSLPYAWVLVNGEERANFQEKQITLKVNNGDIIEINSNFYKIPCIFRIVGVTKNVVRPEVGQGITLQSDRGVIGRVVLK